MSILLYSGPLSLFSRKIEIALREKGLSFERAMVPFTQEAGYQPVHPAVVAANPRRQVPVLVDGGLTLFDSTVILEYLEDAYPRPPLYPGDPIGRARCRMLELEADEVLLPHVRPLMHRSVPPVPDVDARARRVEDARLGEERIAAYHDGLARKLGDGPFLCGAFTVADIAMFMMVHWSLRLHGPGLGRHPALRDWYARVAARPSVAIAVAEVAAADRELSPALAR